LDLKGEGGGGRERGRKGERELKGAYRPWRGSAAHIMFLASNCCWVNSGTVRARYCWEPRDVWRDGGREDEGKEGRRIK